jgi:hypothetical protein
VLCLAVFLIFVVFSRRKAGRTLAMPLLVVGLAVVRLALTLVTVAQLIALFKHLGTVPAEGKQAALDAGIREAMRYAGFAAWVDLPVMLGAWLVDRALLKRSAPSTLAPTGARCATHPEVVAGRVCSRCGNFMCSACDDRGVCPSCRARTA